MSTGRERITAALAGRDIDPFPCGPLAVHVTAALAGVDIEAYTLQPEIMVDCICRYAERFSPDAVWLSADTWITAEAMGAAVAFPGDQQPMAGAGEARVQSASDLDRIPPPDPSRLGRMPRMLEALRLLRERLGDEVFMVACFDQSPFSLACALGGINEVMVKAITDRPFVEALMQHGQQHAVAYGKALAANGADLLSTGDSPAGLLGPELYRELALPAEQRVFEALRDTGVPCSLHICGQATAILPDMVRSGAQVLEIDQRVDLAEACALVPDDIALWGNLDPVMLQRGSTAEIRAASTAAVQAVRNAGRRRFVLSSGCTLAPDTPPDAIQALLHPDDINGIPDEPAS